MVRINKYFLVFLVFLSGGLSAQQLGRPFIWVRPDEKSAILEKIQKQDWAQKIYTDFIDQLDQEIKGHQTDPGLFLQDLPLDWEKKQSNQYPPFHPTYHIENGDHKNLDNATDEEMANARMLIQYLQTGIDCGMAYYLTEEEKYGQCATDILYSFVKAVLRSEVSDWQGRGGWLFPDIGDSLQFLNDDLGIEPTPERYLDNAGLPWEQNRQYRHPGWHFFEEVQTTENYKNGVRVRFGAENFQKPIYMDLHIPSDECRDYTKVLAPSTFEAPVPYENEPTPTLVIRKTGEAWDDPFVLVFEPFDGNTENHSIQSVEKLEQDGKFKGLRVQSSVAGRVLVQYIIAQAKEEQFNDEKLGISFKGSFAIITENSARKLQNIYIGKGEELKYGEITMKPTNQKKSVYRTF